MGLFGLFRRGGKDRTADAARSAATMAAMAHLFSGLDDPALEDFIRGGRETASGAVVTPGTAMRNMAVLRCLSLISRSIGMLPMNLHRSGTVEKASDHPVHRLLAKAPNEWQTPAVFKSTMQLRALVHGNAYAYPVRSRGQVVRLFPLEPERVRAEQNDDWTVEYRYTRKDGGEMRIPAGDMFHLRDLSMDGLCGVSRTQLAREAIGLAMRAERAAAKLFRNGLLLGGYLSSPNTLSDGAIDRLKVQMEEFRGSDGAQSWPVLEEGLKAEKMAQTSKDSQHLESREHQIAEIARAFDVPRPLLMMDETAWGTGIEQLGLFFIQFGLAPWFTAWEQEAARVLLGERDRENFYVKVNERALLRGSLKDQSEFFARALGAGGQDPWMSQDEVRGLADLPPRGGDAEGLKPGYGRKAQAPTQGNTDEPAQPS